MRNSTAMSRRVAVTAIAATAALLLVLAPARGLTVGPVLTIESVDLAQDGTSSLVFRAPPEVGPIRAADVVLLEDGEPVEGLDLTLVTEPQDQAPVTLAVLIDTSGSTAGEAIAAARDAASAFVADVVERGVEVVLIAFADEARLLVGPTSDAGALQQAIAGLEAGGDTALNDAVLLAARRLLDLSGERRALLFTDGRDDGSSTALATVVDAVRVAGIPVSSILLQTGDTDQTALESLAAAGGGTVESVGQVSELASAFERASLELPSVYRLDWSSQRRTSTELLLDLQVTTADVRAVDTALVLNPRRGVPTPPTPVELPTGGIFSTAGGLIAYALLAAGLAALLALLLAPRPQRQTKRALLAARGDRPMSRAERRQEIRDEQPDDVPLFTRLRGRAASLFESTERAPSRNVDELALRIERAGWSLRPAEFQVVRLATAGLFLVMGFGLAQNVFVAAGLAALGSFVPGMLADRSHRKRKTAFVEQLPDVLQLIAGSLKAGYGLSQAIDLVVEESQAPISDEFGRVLSEHLLGLELEDALTSLADRIDSEELRWVVVAMNVQRRVGGNLAELLETVAQTLRDRAAVKRHVRSLAAEGKLSARILTVMPFLIGLYVWVVNPEYISLLFTDRRGQIMLVAAIVAMGVGALWMKRLVDVDV